MTTSKDAMKTWNILAEPMGDARNCANCYYDRFNDDHGPGCCDDYIGLCGMHRSEFDVLKWRWDQYD